MVNQTVPTIADRWRLVRGASIARNLRHLLLILMHYQGKNDTVWCRRELLADELDINVDVVSQKLKELDTLGIIDRVWRNRNGRPSRQYSIQFSELSIHQRTLSESSDCTLRESSDCDTFTLSESSGSPLANPQGHSERILRHEQPVEQPREQSLSNGKRASLEGWIKYGASYATSKDMNTSTDRLEESFDHYTANGWKQNSGRPIKDWKATCRQSVRNHHQWNGSAETSGCYASVRQTIVSVYSPDLRNEADVKAKLTAEEFSAAKLVGIRRIAESQPYDKATAEAYAAKRKAIA